MKNPEIVGAILGGSLIIAAGLYFGLRSVPASVPSLPVTTTEPAPTTPSQPARAEPIPSAPSVSSTAVAKDVEQAIAKLKPALVEKCWKPLAAKDPQPTSVKVTFNGTIGANGKPTAFGLSDDREAYREGLGTCLTTELAALAVQPIAQPTEVSVKFIIP